MESVRAELHVGNALRDEVRPVKVLAVADSGAILTCIPEAVARHLKLETVEVRPVVQPDGSTAPVPYVGPLRVRFQTCNAFCGALVMGGEVLLGTLQMDDMNLRLFPEQKRLDFTVKTLHRRRPLVQEKPSLVAGSGSPGSIPEKLSSLEHETGASAPRY